MRRLKTPLLKLPIDRSQLSPIICVYRMSGELPFAAQTTENEDEDEDEAVAKLVKRCKWSFDSKAFQRCTSEVKSLISSLITFDQE